MKSRTLSLLCALAVIAAGALLTNNQTIEADDRAAEAVRIASKKITDENPDVRAQAVADLARANNEDGTRYVMQALMAENDGPAGFAMAKSIATMTSKEALEVVSDKLMSWNNPETLFAAYWCSLGLALQNTKEADAILTTAIVEETDEDDIYLRAGVIEALAEAGRDEMNELLLTVLKTYDPEWDEDKPIIVTTMIHAAPKMVSKKREDTEQRNKVVLALADILEKTEDERIEWFTCTALAEITGEDTYIDVAFWRWWVESGGQRIENKSKDGATVAGRDVPKFFETAAVGKRVVFVIDISGSMQHPANLPPEMKRPPKDEPEEEDEDRGPVTGKDSGKKGGDKDSEDEEGKEIPPPDYSRIVSKLDLAKVELIHTLKYLPEDYWFNIVIYDTYHKMINQSQDEFVRATESNKKKYTRRVNDLEWASQTNIHGALNRSFCVNMRDSLDPEKIGKSENNPAWDPECLKTGATTIFFLTDGSPTVSDDMDDKGAVGRPGGPRIGNGRMVNPNNIMWDIKRLNTFRKCVINTVGIGPHNSGLLQALSRISGGEYVDRSGMGG